MFALFVFLVVIVMMNLLTGMALMDVQAVANQSTDKTWLAQAKTMHAWENGLIRLHEMAPR